MNTSEERDLRQLKDLFERLAYMQHVTFAEGKQTEKEFIKEFNDIIDNNIDLLHY